MAKTGILKGRWTVWAFSLFFAVLAGFGTLAIVGSAAERVSYFVLTADAAARTQIAPEMVTRVEVPADALPPTALTEEQIVTGGYFTKIALAAGTVLTSSVVTEGLAPLAEEIPDGFVAASLLVSPENAAGGRIKKGDFVNIIADGEGGSRLLIHYALVLDVTVAPATVADAAADDPSMAPGPDSAALYGGIPQVYTFAVSYEDSVALAAIRSLNAYLTLVPGTPRDQVDITRGQDLFGGGPVGPSYTGSTTPAPAPTAPADGTDAAAAVEEFLAAHAGDELGLDAGDLVAYDLDGAEIARIDLAGGDFDLPSRTYTPAP